MRGRLREWINRHWEVLLPFAVWSIPPVGFIVTWYGELRGDMLGRLALTSLRCVIYAGFSPLIFSTVRRYRVRDVGPHVAVIVVMVLAQGLVLIGLLANVPTLHELEWSPLSDPLRAAAGLFATTTVLYIATALVGYAIDSTRRSREQEAHAARLATRLAEARLAMLRAQLNPHFLFNSLNAVAGLVRAQDNAGAVRVLARLSDALRHVLSTSDVHEVPLREELAFVDDYVEIERVRFPDRVHVEWCVSPDVIDAKVPSLVLQPLVENALRQGAGHLLVAARRIGPSLRLEVHDDGPGLTAPAASPGAAGLGLANTRARLAELYGTSADLSLTNAESGGVIAIVSLPYHT